MKNTVIFALVQYTVSRVSTARTNKAGFFYVSDKGVSLPIKRRPAFTEPQREAIPAKVVCWTAVVGGPLFLSAYKCPTHHAHRNQDADRGANPTRRTLLAPCPRSPRLAPACISAGKRISTNRAFLAGNPCCKTSVNHYY